MFFPHVGHSRVLLQIAGVVPSQLLLELLSCPYCTRALENLDLELSDSDHSSLEGDVVYEFSHGAEFKPSHAPHHEILEERNRLAQYWEDFRDRLTRIVDNKYFNRGIMIAILINTLSMGIEYHDQVSASVGSFMNILNTYSALTECCRDGVFLLAKSRKRLNIL